MKQIPRAIGEFEFRRKPPNEIELYIEDNRIGTLRIDHPDFNKKIDRFGRAHKKMNDVDPADQKRNFNAFCAPLGIPDPKNDVFEPLLRSVTLENGRVFIGYGYAIYVDSHNAITDITLFSVPDVNLLQKLLRPGKHGPKRHH